MATKQAKPLRKEPAMYYIEGTIDFIDLDAIVSFALIPSSPFIISVGTEKRILFIKGASSSVAKLISFVEKNGNGNEIVKFEVSSSIGKSKIDGGILLTAKNNRNLIRVYSDDIKNNSRMSACKISIL